MEARFLKIRKVALGPRFGRGINPDLNPRIHYMCETADS
jgi:hypothetical protein